MGKRGRLVVLVVFSLLLLSVFSAGAYAGEYVARVQLSLEKSFYGPNEEVRLTGSVFLSNLSANDTGFIAVSGASVNFSISNSSANGSVLQSNYALNTSAEGSFKSRSDLVPSGIRVNVPVSDGYYNLSAAYLDPNNVEWKATGAVKVFANAVDQVSISPAEARYYAGEAVVVTLRALKEAGDRKVALPQVIINGSMRYTNRTSISAFSCTTQNDGTCTTSVTAPSTAATYLLEANNFLSTSSFVVVPFEAFVYVKDSTGESFKEIFKANEVATIEVNVKSNGTLPTGDFVVNGTITDSNSKVVANISSTTLDSNNSYLNRFSFTISNAFTNGAYFVSVTVYKTGTSSKVSASTSFQVRSWSLTVVKASQNSGFDYEYTTFPGKNVTFEVFPKDYENGTVITGFNSSQFNVTLGSKTGAVLAVGNATYNASCSSSGCYNFALQMPPAAGRYLLAVSLNYSGEVQTVHRLVSVTTTSLLATPSNAEGQLKELFGTTEFVYVSLSAKNTTSSVNITDVLVESVIYENGTKFNFSEVASWSNVSSNNSALEWAWNGSAQILKLDAPKTGGNYLINVFINNRSAAASTKFSINPYSVCGAAKSTAGSVDSSNSFYVWQYKTTDTIYLELKISQAQNGLGRAVAGNSTFNSANYGMGNACYIDTTKSQAITNATIVVESVANLQTSTKIALNTSASTCSADDNSGTYTCTVKPETKWDGGRYTVKLRITGPDSETVDTAESIFEARAFYIWAYSNSWTNKPSSNITFNVQMYEAGTNWWSNYGSSGGINGEVAIQKVEYNGKDGEWLWPPIDIGYNITGLNTSNITNGRGTFTLETSRLSKGRWEPGYYVVTIKGTNNANGESDYGQAWLGIRQWDAYSNPIDTSGGSFRYKDSFGVRENISLYIRITNAGDYTDNGGTNLAAGGNVSVGIKKLQYYTTWPPTELNKTAYTAKAINVTTSSPWYGSANPSTHNKYVLNITPASGKWDGGYYNIILDVNGSETGYGWFNVVAFGIDTQPTNANGAYTYASKGSGPRYFNVTTTKNKKAYYNYYAANDYINTTFKDMVLRLWREDTWKTEEFNYPENLNVSPSQVNGSALVMVNKSGSWPSGYYWGEITLQDYENSTGTGYLWFSVRSFRVDSSALNYSIDSDSNASVRVNIKEPDWSNNALVGGNYTITEIYEDIWSGSGRSRTSYTNYRPDSSSWFNATTILNITPSGTWSSGSYGGYHYLTLAVRDNSDNTTQTGWVSFRAVPYSVSVGSVSNPYSFSQTSNVTVPVTVTKATSGAASTANLSRAFEWTWPTQTEYGVAVGNCTSAANGTACQVTGTQNVTIVMPSGGWPAGWHYINLELVAPGGGSKTQADNSVWFNAIQAYDGYFNNADEGGYYKYNFDFKENITIKIYVRNTNYVPQNVNITKVEMSEDGDACWSEYCKTYSNYSYQVLNGSGGNEIRGNGTIRIIRPAAQSQWKRGQHSIKATITGSAGNAVIKTGYVYVKDTSALNLTIVSPQNGAVVGNFFLFNATTNKDAKCSPNVVSYDTFFSWYCGGGSNSTNPAACNSSRFNGSAYYYQYINYPPWGPMNTGGQVHYYNFSTEGWSNQDYGINVWCYDADWNSVQGKVAFTRNGTVGSIAVRVNLTSPANNSVANASNIPFIFNVTGPSSSTANCSVYVNVSNLWRANVTNTVSNITNTTTATFNIGGFNNGTYIWNTYCYHSTNASNSAWAASNFTFGVAINSTSSTVNTTAVNITLNSPANGSTANNTGTTYMYTIANVGNATCDLYTNTTGSWHLNRTSSNVPAGGSQQFATSGISAGNYLWNVYCVNTTDSSKAGWGNANFTFDAVANATHVPVGVNLSSPANNAATNSSPVTFIYNASGPSAGMTCALWSNSTGSWAANSTNSSATPGVQNLTHNFVNGTYVWNSKCVDNSNSSNYAWAASNFTLAVTNISGTSSSNITVNLSSPANSSTLAATAAASFVYNSSGASSLNCTVWGNFTGGAWASNLTNNSVSAGTIQGGSLNLTAGSYLWNTKCMDATDSNIYAWAQYNWTFTKNST